MCLQDSGLALAKYVRMYNIKNSKLTKTMLIKLHILDLIVIEVKKNPFHSYIEQWSAAFFSENNHERAKYACVFFIQVINYLKRFNTN